MAERESLFTLSDLDAIIAARAQAAEQESYTAALLSRGASHCARKLGEEAVETVVAATAGGRRELTAEAADLLYHLLVLLRAREVPLADVLAELQSRTARSGIAEKASRDPATPG